MKLFEKIWTVLFVISFLVGISVAVIFPTTIYANMCIIGMISMLFITILYSLLKNIPRNNEE